MQKRLLLIIFSVFLLLAACGKNTGPEEPKPQPPACDWQEKGFVLRDVSGDAYPDHTLFAVGYGRIESAVSDDAWSRAVLHAAGEDFITYHTYPMEDGWHYLVQRIDAEGEVQVSKELTPVLWGIPDGSIAAMDVAGPEQYVFWVSSDVQEDANGDLCAGHFYAIYTDADFREQKRTDLIDLLKEKNIWKHRRKHVSYQGDTVRCDGRGNLYLYDGDSVTVYLLDPEGQLLTDYKYPGEKDNGFYTLRADSGEEILICQADGGTEWIWLDSESGQAKRLAALEKSEFVRKWYGLQGDTLYYATRSQILGWNVSTGEKEVLLQLAESEITDPDMTFFQKTEEGARLLVIGIGEKYVAKLSKEKPQRQGDLQLLDLAGTSSAFLKGRVAAFSRENPLLGVEYVSCDEESAERVLIEMANGKGPAIAFVSREDMESLQGKGALADLTPLLSADNREALLPGAVSAGTYEGGLFGLPVSIYRIDSVTVSRDYWQKDNWTVGEVMDLVEQRTELKGLFMNLEASYFQNLYVLLGRDLEHSHFIRDGKCYFDGEEFRDLLKTVKTRGNAQELHTGEFAESYALLREGEILGIRDFFFNLGDYCRWKEMGGGEEFVLAGFPSELGTGHYLDIQGMLVVNQNAADREGVRELLNYLLCLESQRMVKDQTSVRLDVPETLIQYKEKLGGYFVINPDSDTTRRQVAGDYDEHYLDEYRHLLETAVPAPVSSTELFDILWEEAEKYFQSDKSAEEVCEVIQSRVQLYLDEQK